MSRKTQEWLRHVLFLEALVVYKISAFAISLSFLGPWDSCIWSHTEKKKKKKSQNKRFIVLQTDELYLPTLLLSSIACAWWARRWGCWGSGDCARGSAGLALAHLLVSRPQPCRAQGPWHSPYAFFQTSLPNLGRFLAIPRLCFWYNFWTQKESLASHTAWLRSHQNFKMKINYTSLFSVSVI